MAALLRWRLPSWEELTSLGPRRRLRGYGCIVGIGSSSWRTYSEPDISYALYPARRSLSYAPVLLPANAGAWYLEQTVRAIVASYLARNARIAPDRVALFAEEKTGEVMVLERR
jgi:hypothetical protein